MTTHDGNRPQRSLAARLGAAVRAKLASERSRPRATADSAPWQIPVAVAVLLALGPVVTIAGANLQAGRERAEVVRLDAVVEPRRNAEAVAQRDRAELATILQRRTIGAVIESIARALPAEAALLGAQRGRDGLLEIEVRTPDPDKLRAALRREPALARLRDSDQRQGDAAMIVSFKERVP